MDDKETIFTIGHSTRDIGKFADMLRSHGVTMLADIRTIPRSKHNPQFNKDLLGESLKGFKIGYVHMQELGGLRKAKPDSINTGWRNASFRGYADYMQTQEFKNGLEKLIELGREKKVAIMCAEGSPFRCHRSLVADALAARGIKVIHISSTVNESPHTITRFAKVDGGTVTYPGEAQARRLEEWQGKGEKKAGA